MNRENIKQIFSRHNAEIYSIASEIQQSLPTVHLDFIVALILLILVIDTSNLNISDANYLLINRINMEKKKSELLRVNNLMKSKNIDNEYVIVKPPSMSVSRYFTMMWDIINNDNTYLSNSDSIKNVDLKENSSLNKKKGSSEELDVI